MNPPQSCRSETEAFLSDNSSLGMPFDQGAGNRGNAGVIDDQEFPVQQWQGLSSERVQGLVQVARVRIVGAQPSEGSRIPGIRKWPQEYLPKIYDPSLVDELVYVSQADAEDMARRLAREEGIFAGISAAGACWVALQLARTLQNATIVFIVCDRGDRYLSTGVFPA